MERGRLLDLEYSVESGRRAAFLFRGADGGDGDSNLGACSGVRTFALERVCSNTLGVLGEAIVTPGPFIFLASLKGIGGGSSGRCMGRGGGLFSIPMYRRRILLKAMRRRVR